MKKVLVREWKDLSKKEQEEALKREISVNVDGELEALSFDLDNGAITEEQYYEKLGCTKHYAETTAWFVPSCFYEKHKKDIDTMSKENVKGYIYDIFGCPISL